MSIRLSEVISALSCALDITEGQPQGHAARSCMIGMKIARVIGLDADDCRALFYALLMKDLGCSSNAAKMTYLFANEDQRTKRAFKTVDWSTFLGTVKYIARNVAPDANHWHRLMQIVRLAKAGPKEARGMIELRCERGAQIARELMFPEKTAEAIRGLDEHWDGRGHPDGLKREQIPLLSRILGIAQTVEVFIAEFGLDEACAMAKRRRGRWFDPAMVDAFLSFRNDREFWEIYHSTDPAEAAVMFEPLDETAVADGPMLDRIAGGFAKVIDAKSPWTFKHSDGVARIASGIAQTMGLDPITVRIVHRAGLMHDIGKLGVPNTILDKPGKLDDEELKRMRQHAAFTQAILSKIAGFSDLAELAASHHERLDGKGYHRGIDGSRMPTPARILAVADMYEALAARRPYRQDMTSEQVDSILSRNVGSGICPQAYEGLHAYLAGGGYTPMKVAA